MHTGYINELLEETTKICSDCSISTIQLSETPEPLCSDFDRPEKGVAVKAHKTRFGIL